MWLVVSAQLASQSAAPLVISTIDVLGARRYAVGDVVKLSGLAPGQTVGVADLDVTVNRLASTGLFTQVSYRYATRAGRTAVTFEIAEPEWTMPVEFDNFAWFPDEVIVAAMREKVPSFDGTAPVLDGFTDLLTRELQQFLASKNIAGTVVFRPQGTIAKGIERYTFRVANPAPKLCALSFTGVQAIPEADLKSALGLPPDFDHSTTFLRTACAGTVVHLYRRKGHWRAVCDNPRATFVQAEGCAGAAVTIAVTEGAAYTVARKEWAGNTVLPSSQLDALMPLANGAVARIDKIEEGEREIRMAYGTHGHIAQQLSYETRLDDASKTAVLAFTVTEGPQFRMGELRFSGLDAAGTAALTKEWRLKPGEIFNASYPASYSKDVIQPRLRPGTKLPSFKMGVDADKQIVNVEIAFGG